MQNLSSRFSEFICGTVLWTPAFLRLLEFKTNDQSSQNRWLIRLACGNKNVKLYAGNDITVHSKQREMLGVFYIGEHKCIKQQQWIYQATAKAGSQSSADA